MSGVAQDIVLEAECGIENVPAAAPAVLNVLGHSKFGRLKNMSHELVEQVLIHLFGMLACNHISSKGNSAGGEGHNSLVVARLGAEWLWLGPLALQALAMDNRGPHAGAAGGAC